MKLMSILTLSLIITGSQNDLDKDKFIGEWVWTKSELSGRGGIMVTDPITENRSKSIVITNDFKIKVIQNGNLICNDNFTFSKINTEDTYLPSKENCSIGTIEISNDTLRTYKYLGCPSITSYYVKVKV